MTKQAGNGKETCLLLKEGDVVTYEEKSPSPGEEMILVSPSPTDHLLHLTW